MLSLADKALDLAVVPGFTSVGYRLREGGWEPTPRLDGREIVVTGASAGLGRATTALLAAAGARVHMVVRDLDRGARARTAIEEQLGAGHGPMELWRCDLSEPESVRDFARSISGSVPHIDALVNNAGVMAPEREQTSAGVELTFATNVLGPFLLTALLAPALCASDSGRVVNVTSGGLYASGLDADDLQLKRRGYDPAGFYAHTKRCELILTQLWQERASEAVRTSGVTFHATHPGWADTQGVRDSLPRFHSLFAPVLRSPEQGADTSAWLCWAKRPTREPGKFWHDREPRPMHRFPWTRESAADRDALWEYCADLADARDEVWAVSKPVELVAN